MIEYLKSISEIVFNAESFHLYPYQISILTNIPAMEPFWVAIPEHIIEERSCLRGLFWNNTNEICSIQVFLHQIDRT